MLGNLSMGNMSGMIGAAISIAVAGIVLLTVAPGIVGDIDQIYLNGQNACQFNDERFTRVSATGTGTDGAFTAAETADAVWGAATAFTAVEVGSSACSLTISGGTSGTTSVYTPGGQVLKASSATEQMPATVTRVASFQSLTALGGGSLVTLLFGAMAIMLPVGAIAFLGYMGGQLVQQNVGQGGGMAVAIAAAVGTAVVAAILPSVFQPLDSFYQSLDGIRYAVYSTGIGRLGGVLGDFLAVALIAGIIVLGALLWKGQKGDGGMGYRNGNGGGNMSF